MEDSYLFQVLNALDTGEKEEFMAFVASGLSGWGHFHRETLLLLELIFANSDIQPFADGSKEALYQHLFPGQDFIRGKVEKTMSELNKAVRAFLLWKRYNRPENTFEQLFDWAQVLRERKLEQRYQQALNKVAKVQGGLPHRESEFYYQQFLLEFEIHDWLSLNNRKKGDLNIPSTLHHLDIYYYLNRLELLNRFLLQSKVTYLEIPETLAFALEETRIPERYLQESCVLRITYEIHLVLKNLKPLPEEFDKLSNLLLRHEAEISSTLLQQFYTYLRNLCVYLIHSGSGEMRMVLHRLQQDNLKRGYLYYNGLITASAFLSITTIGLKVKNFEWVREFIADHEKKIIGDNESRDFYRLGLAYYYFETGQYEKALDNVPPTSPDTDFLLKSRRLELMIYYELDSDLLPYKIDAFKMFISRASNKLIPAQTREFNINFINLLFQVASSAPGDKVRAQRLMQRIRSKQAVSEKEWLLEKAAAIG